METVILRAGWARGAGHAGGSKPRPHREASGLLLPAAAEGTVKLNETLVFGTSSACESEFRGKEGALAVQDFEIRGRASLVAHIGQANGLHEVCNAIFLTDSDLVVLLVADECIGNIAERVLNRL